jgi:H(+)-translocating pyrophosphatase
MESTTLPSILISAALLGSYYLGNASGINDHHTGLPIGGLFGTAVATMGMLSSAVFVLTMDFFGPIADNAGGIVEMGNQPESVREVTDLLDAVGNTTKAATKGFAIGSAALACFLLFSAFMDEVSLFTRKPFKVVDIAQPEVFVGGLLGAAMVMLFSSWALASVSRAAQQVVAECRQQFSEHPGIMAKTEKPNYKLCVSLITKAALSEMVRPGLLAVFTPIIIGVMFKQLGDITGDPQLGPKAIAGMLMFSTVCGVQMSLYMNNAGGAWDNAKKLVETGAYGGKNSEAHKATVTGDTVGDPFKDTAGPSLHVLIKMLSTITLVMTPIFVTVATGPADGKVGGLDSMSKGF